MEDMAYYCDNVVVMNRGRVFKSGNVGEVFSNAKELSEIGLDVPVVSRIANRLREEGVILEGELYTVEGMKDAIIKYVGGKRK